MDQARTLRRLADDARQQQLQTLWPGQADRSGPYPASVHPSVKVLSFTSGKGGVGKTHIVVNLAYALQSLGARVMLLDADLGLANVDVLLGLAPRFTIQHVLGTQEPRRCAHHRPRRHADSAGRFRGARTGGAQ